MDLGCVFPKAFEVVEVALVLVEEVDDEVNGIHDHPAAVVAFVFGVDFVTQWSEQGIHFPEEGFEVGCGGSCGNDKIIGDGEGVPHVQDDDVHGFFVVESFATEGDVLKDLLRGVVSGGFQCWH